MTSEVQAGANRSNALVSTGPRTPAGKARSAQNALRHGLRAAAPVLPGESPQEWEDHRAGVLQSLRAEGALEQCLAERVALALWRLRRAAAYEVAVTAAGLLEIPEELRQPGLMEKTDHQQLEETLKELQEKQEAVRQSEGTARLLDRLPALPDLEPVGGDDAWGAFRDLLDEMPEDAEEVDAYAAPFLNGVGVPPAEHDDPYGWRGWTVRMVKQGLDRIARSARRPPAKLLEWAARRRREKQEQGQDEVQRLTQKVKDLRRRLRDREARLRLRRLLPDGAALEKVTRYEAHLQRQMLQTLHELQRLQAARAGAAVPPPAALDVTLDTPQESIRGAGDGAGGA
jgi:hypothetical protein